MNWYSINNSCSRTGCPNKTIDGSMTCSMECTGWLLSAKLCSSMFCMNYTKTDVCYKCFMKNKGHNTECLTHKCFIKTNDLFCIKCKPITNTCQNPDCDRKAKDKYCGKCYTRHKNGKTPLHECTNTNCTNDTYIHLKYCQACHSNYKNTHKKCIYNGNEFTLTLCN